MKRRIATVLVFALAVSFLVFPVQAVSSFPDVREDAEYAEAVEYLKGNRIMVGDDHGNFNPNKAVTRAEMATIICNMLGEAGNSVNAGGIFTDVSASHWASGYIAKAVSLGIISGYGNRKFGPNDKVTYEQAVTMIVRAGYGSEDAQNAGGYPNGFLHMAEIYGLLEGIHINNGTLLTRAQVAMLLYNYCLGFVM